MLGVTLTLLALGQSPPGFVKPAPGTLTKVLGIRETHDLSEFALLEVNEEEWTSPLISEDNVRAFVGTRRGRLVAYDLSTGEELWKRDDMGAIGFGMLEYQQRLILGSDSALVALDQQLGREKWRLDLDAPIGGRMTRAGNIAVIPIRPNAFVAVDLDKGERLWRTKRPTPDGISVRGQAAPTIDRRSGRAYLGYSDGALVAVDLATGQNKWVALLGNAREFFADVDSRPILVDNDKSVVAAAYNGGLFKLEAETGRTIWKKEHKRIHGLVQAGASILIASHGDGQVLGISAQSGNVIWRYKVRTGAPVEPVFIGRNQVAVGCTNGPIAVLDVTTGRPIQLVGSAISVPPAWDDPDMVVLTNKALVLMMRYGAGTAVAR